MFQTTQAFLRYGLVEGPYAKGLSTAGWHNRRQRRCDRSRAVGMGSSPRYTAVSSRPSLSSGVDAERVHPGRVDSPDANSVFLEEDAPARGIDRHGEVREDAGAQESGFAREKLPCMKARLHAADPIFGKINNRVDISDGAT